MRLFAIAPLVLILLGRCNAFVKPAFGRSPYRSRSIVFGLRCGHQDDLACNEEEAATEAPLEEEEEEDQEIQNISKRDFLRLQYRGVRHAVAKVWVFTNDDSPLKNGTGTGVLWDHDGHVVTCYHNIQNATRISLRLGGMIQTVDAKILGAEPERDIAVLKISNHTEYSLPEPIIKTTAMDLYPGEPVVAVGHPGGYDFTMTSGIVSAVFRDALVSGQLYPGCLQTDATVSKGFSGGPLVNEWGKLVGILIGGTGDMAFAVPSETVNRIVNQIIVNGRSTRPAIGGYVFSPIMESNIEESRDGMLAVPFLRLVPNSPLADAGLIPVIDNNCDSPTEGGFHLIWNVDGMRVHKVGQLRAIMDAKEPGDVLELDVVRPEGGMETLLVNVTSVESLDIDKEKNWIDGRNSSAIKVVRTNRSGAVTVDKSGVVHFDDTVHEEDASAEMYDVLV